MSADNEKVLLTVTLKQLRHAKACVSGYNRLVCYLSGKTFNSDRGSYIRFKHDTPINLLTILYSNGAADCVWALRAVVGTQTEFIARMLAADFAESVLHTFESAHPTDNRPRLAIQAARDFVQGKITEEQRIAAWSAAWSAAQVAAAGASRVTAGSAAWSAAVAAWSAADAAGSAAWSAVRSAARSAWSAAESATWAAAESAAESAWAAAWAAAGSAQKEELLRIISGGEY
jgi:hypothetical protein